MRLTFGILQGKIPIIRFSLVTNIQISSIVLIIKQIDLFKCDIQSQIAFG